MANKFKLGTILTAVAVSFLLLSGSLVEAVTGMPQDSAGEMIAQTSESSSEQPTISTSSSASETETTTSSQTMQTSQSNEEPTSLTIETPLEVARNISKKELQKKIETIIKGVKPTATKIEIVALPELIKAGRYQVTADLSLKEERQPKFRVNLQLVARDILKIELKPEADWPAINLGQAASEVDIWQYVKEIRVIDGIQLKVIKNQAELAETAYQATVAFNNSEQRALLVTDENRTNGNGITEPNKEPITMGIKVHNEENGESLESSPLKIPVTWGTSLTFGSYDLGGNGRTSGAFPLLQDEQGLYLTYARGIDAVTNEAAEKDRFEDEIYLHKSFSQERYWGLRFQRAEQLKQSSALSEAFTDAQGEVIIETSGDNYKKDLYQKFNQEYQNGKYYLSPGGVLQSWMTESDKNWLIDEQTPNHGMYENDRPVLTGKRKAIYYEVTQKGSLNRIDANLLELKKEYPRFEYSELHKENSNLDDLWRMFSMTKAGWTKAIKTRRLTIDQASVQKILDLPAANYPQMVSVRIKEKLTGGQEYYFDYQLPILILDEHGPHGVVKPTIVKQGAQLPNESNLGAEIKSTFFSEIIDLDTPVEKITATYQSSVAGLTAEIGLKKIDIQLTDEAGHQNIFQVPLYVVAGEVPDPPGQYLIVADPAVTYSPEEAQGFVDQGAFKKDIIKKSRAKAWELFSGIEVTKDLKIEETLATDIGQQQISLRLPDGTCLDLQLNIKETTEINVQLPKKMLFGSSNLATIPGDTNGLVNVFSPRYQIHNLSPKSQLEVLLADVQVLKDPLEMHPINLMSGFKPVPQMPGDLALRMRTFKEGQNPSQSASVNIYEGPVINQRPMIMAPKEKYFLNFAGEYLGDFQSPKEIQMRLVFNFSIR